MPSTGRGDRLSIPSARKEWGISGQIGTYIAEGIQIDLYGAEGLEVWEHERNRSV